MRGQSKAIRGLAVVAVALSPLAAVEANAAVETGDANAGGPGIAVENTGGNIEVGKGHVESRVVTGNPSSAPAAPTGLSTLSTPAKKVAPSNDAAARARAAVDAARARAQAQIDAARRQAEEAVEHAQQQADEARARSASQSDEAHAQASDASASSHSSSSTDD